MPHFTFRHSRLSAFLNRTVSAAFQICSLLRSDIFSGHSESFLEPPALPVVFFIQKRPPRNSKTFSRRADFVGDGNGADVPYTLVHFRKGAARQPFFRPFSPPTRRCEIPGCVATAAASAKPKTLVFSMVSGPDTKTVTRVR